MKRFLTGLLALALAWLCTAAAAQDRGLAERRVALVIGNASYKSSPLKNPVNDSRDVATALRGLGFEVLERQNLGREGFATVVREFGDKLRGASVGLFYFAGHGLQVKGRNFLLPVDADIAREDEVQYRSFDVNEVLDKMDSARTPVNLVLLDACRNNPFARSFKTSQSGLAQMDAPTGTLIAFATAPGSVAQDGEGAGNGLYTGALLKHIGTPGLAVEQMFKRVRVDVVGASRNSQVPWESSSLNRDFSFASAAASGPAVAVNPPTAFAATELALDLAFWDAVKDSRNPADYRAYLEQYPTGRFAALARLRASAGPAGATSAAQPPGGSPAAPRPADASVAAVPEQVAATSTSTNAERPVPAGAGVPAATQGSSIVRWQQGSRERTLDLGVGTAPSVQAASPEGLYLAAVAGATVYWIDAVRATLVRSSLAFDQAAEASGVRATGAQFSPDGRWLLLRLQRADQTSHSLIDVSSGQVLWDRPSLGARFEPDAARLSLQGASGASESLRLP